jgi:hypothetical protein
LQNEKKLRFAASTLENSQLKIGTTGLIGKNKTHVTLWKIKSANAEPIF